MSKVGPGEVPRTLAKCAVEGTRFAGRPFSRKTNIHFGGGPLPAFDAPRHAANRRLAWANSSLLTRRLPGDIAYMTQSKKCASGGVNYGIFRCYSLTVRAVKQLVGAPAFSEPYIVPVVAEGSWDAPHEDSVEGR